MRYAIAGIGVLLAACSAPSVVPETEEPEVLPPVESPIARCMNLGNALEAPKGEGEWGYYVRRNDLLRLKEAGFDTVRLPVRWSAHTDGDPPYAVKPEILTRVDEIAGWALLADMQIIINVHHYSKLMQEPEEQYPRLEAIWDQIAEDFAYAPDSVIFEFINEPHGNMSAELTDDINRRLLARLREKQPDRWVILAGSGYGTLPGLEEAKPDYDPRVILTYHDYDPFEFTHQGAYWASNPPPMGAEWGAPEDYARMAEQLDRAAAVQNTTRMPVFVGEFGVYREVPDEQRALWTGALRRGIEEREMSWCYWDFATTLRAFDRTENKWVEPIRAALLDD